MNIRIFLFGSILAVAILFSYTLISTAACGGGPTVFVCDTNNPNPDPVGVQQLGNIGNLSISVLPGAGIDTTILPGDDDGIETGDGMNDISVDNGSVIAEDRGIRGGNNIEHVTLNNATIHSVTNDTISLLGGNNVINVMNSVLTSVESSIVLTGNDDDMVHISGSELKVLTASGNDIALRTGNGNDQATLENSLLQGGNTTGLLTTAVSLSNGDDTLTIGSGVRLRGLRPGNVESFGIIQCGDDFDTIIFAMAVPTSQLEEITAQIESKDPAGDNITINNLFYQWEDCEELVPQLTGVFSTPVPTLSEWGLIFMAGLLGIAGYMVMRRRKVIA